MAKWLLASLLLAAASACQSHSAGTPKASRSERERDSVIGASQLPGARGVQGALRVSDSAVSRQARADSAGAE
jgi:hypothetical protein